MALVPLAYLIARVAGAGPDAWLAAVTRPRVGTLAATSMLLALVVAIGCLALGVGSAYLVTRTDLPGRRLWAVVAALPLAVPSYVAAFSWSAVADLWSSTARFEGFWAAALVLTLYTAPYVYLPVAAALAATDAGQEEVSRSLGRGPWQTLMTVTLPQVRPAIAAGGLLAVLYALSDFGAVSLLRVDTFTRAIFTALGSGFDRIGALSLASMLVLLTLLILAIEHSTRRRGARYARTGSGVRRSAPMHQLGKYGRWVAYATMMGTALVALGVPAVAMARWSARGLSQPGSVREVLSAASGSIGLALAGALVTTALAIPVGLYAARHPGRLARALEHAAYLAHGLPGVVVGLSLVFLGVAVLLPLYQSVWLLAVGYATLFLPLALAAVAGAAAKAPPGLEEVSHSLGEGPGRTWARVTLPLTLPGVRAGAALVFLACMKELPATLLLRPTGMETLATRLWSATEVQRYAEAAPYAVLLVLVAALPTWLLTVRSGIRGAGVSSEKPHPQVAPESVRVEP
ncbi:ABC transporter permease [Pseudactinotalea sp. Z1732]|uniref:ABC transporter permease n=1 Tax=Pseudactinotalea sp. Z1732 TaxID=3413026 RepID=UPI003C7A55C9